MASEFVFHLLPDHATQLLALGAVDHSLVFDFEVFQDHAQFLAVSEVLICGRSDFVEQLDAGVDKGGTLQSCLMVLVHGVFGFVVVSSVLRKARG